MRRYKQLLLKAMFYSGFTSAIATKISQQSLTVAAYHRIANYSHPEFDEYLPNISATPDAFAEQMDYLKNNYNVIAHSDLFAWFRDGVPLPPKPALITFDDGYRDNFDYAFPILKERNLPATIFLATDYIGQRRPFHWDIAAYCFHHTTQQSANLPLLGLRSWTNIQSQTNILNEWLQRLKEVPESRKLEATNRLPEILNVMLPQDACADLCLTWDQVRLMQDDGIEMGVHTKSHPIMTRVPLEQAYYEVSGAKAKIEDETGRTVTGFAYPNGGVNDFSDVLHSIVQQAGISLGFTLLPAPMPLKQIYSSPIAIRRAFIHNKDSVERFAAKLIGIGRIIRTLA